MERPIWKTVGWGWGWASVECHRGRLWQWANMVETQAPDGGQCCGVGGGTGAVTGVWQSYRPRWWAPCLCWPFSAWDNVAACVCVCREHHTSVDRASASSSKFSLSHTHAHNTRTHTHCRRCRPTQRSPSAPSNPRLPFCRFITAQHPPRSQRMVSKRISPAIRRSHPCAPFRPLSLGGKGPTDFPHHGSVLSAFN